MVDGVEEEKEVGAWLRRCWVASTEEEGEEMGGHIDQGRDGGREEANSEGGSEGGAAFAVIPAVPLCVVGGGGKEREEEGERQSEVFWQHLASPMSAC